VGPSTEQRGSPSHTDLPASGARSRSRIGWTLGVGSIAVVLALIVASTWVGGWGALAHQSCVSSGIVSSQFVWLPTILVNSPYGGSASGNASFPPGFIRGWPFSGNGMSGPSNGSVGGAFLHVEINVTEDHNETVWGPGANDHCGQNFAMASSISFNGSSVYSGVLGNRGNSSDVDEPHGYNFTFPSTPSDSTPYFDNGFTQSNEVGVTTCGTGPESLPMRSPGFTVWLTFAVHGELTVAPYTLPFPQVYHYYFPGDFGTWQVDNLSAPGGPGGGWAFSYSPCP
jgi:hypothetical protein